MLGGNITHKSDAEILELAMPMIDEVVQASNQKNWALFSKYQTKEEARDPENRGTVERLWEEDALFSTLSLEKEILGVLRRDDAAEIVWIQKSTEVPGEFLARYRVRVIDHELKEIGFLIG